MKYTVHLFPIVRVAVIVEADSQVEAMKKADEQTNFHDLFDGLPCAEYAEDIDCFQVDEENDPEYTKSTWYDKDYLPL